MIHLDGVPRVVKFREGENRTEVSRNWEEGEMGSCYLMGIEFGLCKMKKFWRLVVNSVNIFNTTELLPLDMIKRW